MTESCYWLFCFEPISKVPVTKIFGFSEFLTALALLAIVYTIADVRYRFRIAVAPISLYKTTFAIITIIGLGTLLTEIWIIEGWWVPKITWVTYARWQGFFGLLFLVTILTWIYYAFINPPVFGRFNALLFIRELYRYILRGNDDELKVIANELARSAKPLIKNCKCLQPRFPEKETLKKQPKKKKAGVEDYAHDILLLIANRKFCRHIVATSPVTAKVLFDEMINANKFNIPISQFARNISSEAIAQKGSFLYSEADEYLSGLLGYLKPVSQALYGNYFLVESLGKYFSSPLDINFEEQMAWDAKQWEAYCRATLMTIKDFLKKSYVSGDSGVLNSAMENIKNAYHDLYKLNNLPETYSNDIYDRLRAVSEFVKKAIGLIDKQQTLPKPLRRVHEETYPKNIYDHIALLFFDMCFHASMIESPPDTCWHIHHNIVWDTIFNMNEGVAYKIVQVKVCRLLYDEIKRLNTFPNYKSSKILGYCLNIFGMEIWKEKNIYGRHAYALAKAVHSWARKYYLSLRQENPDIAKSVLIGSVSFDETGNRLVKTYIKGLNREAPKSYLDL